MDKATQLPILVVDDDEMSLKIIKKTLFKHDLCEVIACSDSRLVMGHLNDNEINIVMMDLRMPYLDGESLLRKINKEFPHIPVIIVTVSDEVETAVRCMKFGAYDYVVKPVNPERLMVSVRRAAKYRELERENIVLKSRIDSGGLTNPKAFGHIITHNRRMFSMFRHAESVAQSCQPVLVTGETGVGKELMARAIHEISGREGRLVSVNVAGLDDNMFSDTLFGHVKGAFTGADKERGGLIEQARRGTLFLDEIGYLRLASQVKLLRLLQENEYFQLGSDRPKHTNTRFILATNKDLWELHKAGKFSNDFIYRLQTHHLHIPPLRERMDDIPLLVDHFLEKAADKLNRKKPTPPAALFDLLRMYSFCGNIRELESMIMDAVSRHKHKIMSLKTFKAHIEKERNKTETRLHNSGDTGPITFSETMPTFEQSKALVIAEAMRRSGGNITIASEILGISRQSLSRRLNRKNTLQQPAKLN